MACGPAGLVTDRFEQRNPDVWLTGLARAAESQPTVEPARFTIKRGLAGRPWSVVTDTEMPKTDAAARGALMDSSSSLRTV